MRRIHMDKEIESINRKYTELTSKAINDTNNITLNQFLDEVLPKLIKEREEKIAKIKTKKSIK